MGHPITDRAISYLRKEQHAGADHAGAIPALAAPYSNRARPRALAVIDTRRLSRECLVRSIEDVHPDLPVFGYDCVECFLNSFSSRARPDVILLTVGGDLTTDGKDAAGVRRLVTATPDIPVVVLAEREDLRQMIAAIDLGARGYIPGSIGIDGIVEAMNLASKGRVFFSTDFLDSLRTSSRPASQTTPLPAHIVDDFTSRQADVANELRLGKPNKIIAYELDIRESTVKVHIRNILKKLNATNRTEAAHKLNEIYKSRAEQQKRDIN